MCEPRFLSRSWVVFVLLATACPFSAKADDGWHAGFARVDVTPGEPLRMSGYGSRDHDSTGVDTPLFVRAMSLRHADDSTHLLISVDTIGLPGAMTRVLAEQIEKQHGIPRERIVFCSTHTHCAPDLASELTNIFFDDLTESVLDAGKRYRERLQHAIEGAAGKAIADLAPARLAFSQGSVGFAANRRLLKDGRWVNFGVQADGPVDHSVPVLRVTDVDGKVRGAVFNYACHCTTIGGEHYGINSEWAGYAATQIEATHPDSVALCTIGCGADANPEPRGSVELAQLHGRAMAGEVLRLIAAPMTEIERPVVAKFGYAGLSFDLPTDEELARRVKDTTPQVRRNAEHLQETLSEHGRLPATYPVPIQAWRFGDQLTMVFLGGEVVVDYALRLKRELDDPNLWVTAYANDVMGYVCSERMRQEGGYEYDRSAVYYDLPGPWSSGTEDLLIRRVHEVLRDEGHASALTPQEAVDSIRVADGLEVQLVASEPLVADPINIAFGPDGKLWVVEMGDYPLGDGDEGSGGRIKFLTDSDGDGTFDRATTFLEGLDFPTGVFPWRDGVVVSAAPEIFFASDTDGDGHADHRETWYTGFPLANPQHRVNGFTYGLEHALHCASGDNLGELTAVRTGETVNASGRDVRIWPDSGKLDTTSGRTQFIRSRNDWGEWFGNDNSRPMYHYPIEERYLKRNSAVHYSGSFDVLFDPPIAPPVFPRSVTVDRFNDLFAADRFTSACSAIIFRSPNLGSQCNDAALVCEPVHNLVHRSSLKSNGSTYRAQRLPEEQQSEFLASSDSRFRPVRVIEGTDGMMWVVDMYRDVIEHPEWIPEAWQEQLDLRAGSDRGRIYRIVPKGPMETDRQPATSLPRLSEASLVELIESLKSTSGAKRDLAQQLLLCRDDRTDAVSQLEKLAVDGSLPQTRVHALWCLNEMGELSDTIAMQALQDSHFGVVRSALLICESRLVGKPEYLQQLGPLVAHADPRVRLQLALTLGQASDAMAGKILARLVPYATDDPWLSQAILSSASPHALVLLQACLDRLREPASHDDQQPIIDMISKLLTTAVNNGVDVQAEVANSLIAAPVDSNGALPLATAWLGSSRNETSGDSPLGKALQRIYQNAVSVALASEQDETVRSRALEIFGTGLGEPNDERVMLADLLSPRVPLSVQEAAVDRLGAIGGQATFELFVEKWPMLSERIRDTATQEMLRVDDGTKRLLAAIQTKSILPSDLTLATRQRLKSVGGQSSRALAQRLLGDDSDSDLSELVTQYLSVEVDAADAARGAALFNRLCAACHLPDAQGRAAGPNLASLTDRSTRALTEAILNPNLAVDPQYRNYVFLLDGGRTIAGAIAEELGNSITLVQADGKRLSVVRHEIEEMRNTGMSLMPEGMQAELNPQELADVIEFVRAGLATAP